MVDLPVEPVIFQRNDLFQLFTGERTADRFAVLHQMCVPVMEGLDGFPPPQREALRTAFGFPAGPGPGRRTRSGV